MDNLIQRLLRLPPHVVAKKAAARLRRMTSQRAMRIKYLHVSSYARQLPAGPLHRLLEDPALQLTEAETEQLTALCRLVLDHRFDLLGSGWVQVRHGMAPQGVEGHRYPAGERIDPDRDGNWLTRRITPKNRAESKRVWRLLQRSVDRGPTTYRPIDWHLDYKSGYRWPERVWHHETRQFKSPGADIKVPWELARMQHLTWLAQAFGHFRASVDPDLTAQTLQSEFCHQVLDFVATNPPRFGANWTCTMDVAIRISNWLVAYDMFRAQGAEFALEFEKVLSRSVYEHGLFIVQNLEYSPELRTNHYLANVVGLLFCAAWLPDESETKGWLPFAVQELISEMSHQFHPDGSNFEASTCYHRLSTEMMGYGAAICRALPHEKRSMLRDYNHRVFAVRRLRPASEQEYDVDTPTLLPGWFDERLRRALDLPQRLTKPSGVVPQFGDNDSGRFLKLWPRFRRVPALEALSIYSSLSPDGIGLPASDFYWDEVILDHSHLSDLRRALFPDDAVDALAAGGDALRTPEFRWLRRLLQNLATGPSPTVHRDKCATTHSETSAPLSAIEAPQAAHDSVAAWIKELMRSMDPPLLTRFVCDSKNTDLTEGLSIERMEGLGICLATSRELYAAIRCGETGQKGNGGHAHNDQLTLELTLEGRDRTADPGTYLYSASPGRRNEFRSTQAHFTPYPSDGEFSEQASEVLGPTGLFRLGNEAQATVLYFDNDGWVGRHEGFGAPIYRVICLTPNAVDVYDFGASSPGRLHDTVSNGYGRLGPNPLANSLPPSRVATASSLGAPEPESGCSTP